MKKIVLCLLLVGCTPVPWEAVKEAERLCKALDSAPRSVEWAPKGGVMSATCTNGVSVSRQVKP